MKKGILGFFLLGIFLLAGCGNNAIIEEETIDIQGNIGVEIAEESLNNSTLEDAIIGYIADKYDCNDGSKLFVNYAELGMKSLGDGVAERYITTIAEGFYIDERGNLNNSCGFGVPMKIVTSCKDGIHYTVIDSVQARDGNEYDESIREMFSNEAYTIREDGKYYFINEESLLEQAEEYFGVTIITEEENNFECTFCDKLRYYEPSEDEGKSNDLIFNYISTDNGNNTIYFGSDGSFETKGSRDEGTGTWTFGQDENTIIVLNNSSDHVYDRYIITDQTEDSLNTILEIIQRR